MTNTELTPDACERVCDFTTLLREQGYAEGKITHYDRSCRHFVVWLETQKLELVDVNQGCQSRSNNPTSF